MRRTLQDEITLISLPRAIFFIGVVALVCGIGLQRRNLSLLGGSLLAMTAVSWATAPRLRHLKAKRDHLEHTFEDELLRIRLEISPRDLYWPARLVELSDYYPAGDPTRIRAFLPEAFRRGERLVLHYRPKVAARRGLYVLGPIEIASADPLGLRQVYAQLPVMTSLLVYPSATILDDYVPFHTHTVRYLGEHTLPREGLSQEFLRVREYEHGDSPRLVHWPISTRQGELFVKAFEDNTMTEVTLILDLFQLSHTGIGNVTSTEALVATAASLATHAIEKCHYVQLLALNDRPQWIPPGASRAHLYTILNTLALVRPSGRGDFVEAARANIPHLTPGGTAVFLLAATTVEDDLPDLIGELQLRRMRVAVVLIDDRTYELLYMAQQTRAFERESTDSIAARLADLGAEVTILRKGENVREKLELTA